MSSERNRKFATLAHALAQAGIDASASAIERLLNQGRVDVVVPRYENGQAGNADVLVGEVLYACRGIWTGATGDPLFYYTMLHQEMNGVATFEQVSNFTPDVLLTVEVFNDLRKYAKDAHDERAGIDGDVIDLRHADAWARKHGVEI